MHIWIYYTYLFKLMDIAKHYIYVTVRSQAEGRPIVLTISARAYRIYADIKEIIIIT